MQLICTRNPASFSGLCAFVASRVKIIVLLATNARRPGNEAKHSPRGKIGGWQAVLCRWAVLNYIHEKFDHFYFYFFACLPGHVSHLSNLWNIKSIWYGLIVNIKATCILDSEVWEWSSWTDHRINTANLNIQSSYILMSILLAIWKRTDAPGKASFNGCSLLRDVITIQTESCFQSQNVSGPESSQLYPLQCQQPLSQLYYLISRHWDLHT